MKGVGPGGGLTAGGKTSTSKQQGGGGASSSSSGAVVPSNAAPDTALSSKTKAEVIQTEWSNFCNDFEKPTQIYRYLRTRMLHSPLFLLRNLSYMRNRTNRTCKVPKEFKVDVWSKGILDRETQKAKEQVLVNNGIPQNFLNIIVLGFLDSHTWLPDTEAKVDLKVIRVILKKRKESRLPLEEMFSGTCSLKVHPASTESVYKDEFSIPISKGKYPVLNIPKETLNLKNGHVVQSIKILLRVTLPSSKLNEKVRDSQQNGGGDSLDEKVTNTRSSNGASRMSGSLTNSRKNGIISTVNNNNNNNRSVDVEEPKPKRQRSLPTKDRENFIYDNQPKSAARSSTGSTGGGLDIVVYAGIATLYDRESNLNILADGNQDMELRLDKQDSKRSSKVPARAIKRERTWEDLDEKNNPRPQDYLHLNGTTACAAKLAVALRHSEQKIGPTVDPPAPVRCLQHNSCTDLEVRKREANVKVVYRFMHSNNGRQVTESRNDLRCPWCSINCLVLYSLLKHLKICHPRFLFSFASIVSGACVDVTLNESYDGSYSGSAYDLVAQPPGQAFARNGPGKRTQVFHMLVCRPPKMKRSLHEFFDGDEKDAENRRSYVTGHNRLYHHTTTCLPIHPREIDVDSEGEPDPEWLRVKTCMMIDEFTDVNEGEKEIMKMWNHHVMHDNYVGDCQIPLACRKFVERFGKDVIKKNLYRNFILHLTNLFDFGLLPAVAFHATVQLLHSQIKDNNTAPSLRDSWKALASIPSTSTANSNGSYIESMEVDCPTLGSSNTAHPSRNGHAS